MSGNITVLEALIYLSDPDPSCATNFSGSNVESWCCLNTLNCLDMSIYPDVFEDVDALSRDDSICFGVQYLSTCLADDTSAASSSSSLCTNYLPRLKEAFSPYIHVLVDKYTYNGTCSSDYDYVTDDYHWSTWSDTTPPPNVINESGSDTGAIVGGISGVIICALTVALILFIFWTKRKKVNDKNKPNENPVYNLERPRPSLDYADINDGHIEEMRYVRLDLATKERNNSEDNTDSSIFSIAAESPKPGYDGLSNFQRLRMSPEYTALSLDKDSDYILRPESIPDLKPRDYQKPTADPVYFEPKPDEPVQIPTLPRRVSNNYDIDLDDVVFDSDKVDIDSDAFIDSDKVDIDADNTFINSVKVDTESDKVDIDEKATDNDK